MRNFHYISICALLALTVTTVKTHAQNYQPIYSNSLQVFYQEEFFNDINDHHNMWGLKIDSLEVLQPGDTIFHNYPIFRDTVPENNWEYSECAWWNAPNLNGYASKQDTSGIAWFFNKHNDSIRIAHSYPEGHQWVCYEYDTGDTLYAEVQSINHVDDGWVTDSVKTIGFTRSYNGTTVADPINDQTIELYKSKGIRRFLDMVEFPYSTEPILAVTPEIINRYAPGYSNGASPQPLPSVGDYFYRSNRDYQYNSPNSFETYTSTRVLAVDSITGSDSFEVTRKHWRQTYETYLNYDVPPPDPYELVHEWSDINTWSDTETYFSLPDSFITYWVNSSGENLMPRQNRAGYNYSISNLSGCELPLIGINNCYGPIELDPNESDSCVNANFRMTTPCPFNVTASYNPQIGWMGSFTSDLNDLTGEIYFNNRGIHYLEVGDLVCGNYTMVDVPLHEESQTISIFPNPANQSFKIESEVAFDQLSIYNLQGQLIWRSESQLSSYSVDCSQWPNGIYLIRSISDNGLQQEKLIVGH